MTKTAESPEAGADEPAAAAPESFVPTVRPAGLGPFLAVKRFECGCVLTAHAPDPATETVNFTISFRDCKARHVPVPTHAEPRAP